MNAIIKFDNKLIRITNYNPSTLIHKLEILLGYELSEYGKSNVNVLHTYDISDIDEMLLMDIYKVRYNIKYSILD